jgi:hypothetical protein
MTPGRDRSRIYLVALVIAGLALFALRLFVIG